MALKKAFDDMFIESTIKIVSQVGIENMRTKDAAEMTGFSEATLFRHFETKEDLINRTFLCVDRNLSDILTKNAYVLHPDNTPFEFALYHIWHQVYRYLIDHPEETVFLLRFRYSSYYTEEIRTMRAAYDGSFEQAYAVFEKHYGSAQNTYKEFLINYIFEITLSFAERIIAGRIDDNESVEYKVWTIILTSLNVITQKAGTEATL